MPTGENKSSFSPLLLDEISLSSTSFTASINFSVNKASGVKEDN
jgi:hypothetical protein